MLQCFICKHRTEGGYNVFLTSVYDNSKLLITLLEEVTKDKSLHDNGREICSKCYELLNDLHQYQKRIKEIADQLHSYLACSVETKAVSTEAQKIENNYLQKDYDLQKSENTIVKEENTLEAKFKCHVCVKSFITKSGRNKHLRNQHPDEKPDFADEENRTGGSEKLNKNEKPKIFQCSMCPKKWKTKSELKNHLHSHSQEKPFVCEICGHAYKHKAALDVHVDMHNGVCPFTCIYCEKQFTQKGALRRHLPIHTGK